MRMTKKLTAYAGIISMVASLLVCPTATKAAKAKVPKFARKTYKVEVGKKITVKTKNTTKKMKVSFKIDKKKFAKLTKKKSGKNAYAKIKGVKVGKVKVTATIKTGKKTKKIKCKVNVVAPAKKTVTQAPGNGQVALPTQNPGNVVNPTAEPVPTPDPFTIIDNKKADAMMYIDPNDSEYDGISLIADAFKADVARVIGVGTDEEGNANESPDGLKVVTDSSALSGKAVIAGTFGENGNSVINKLISEGKIDVSAINGKWECYKMQVVKNPVPGVAEALVIAGSDKRGTIYGIFRVSELMGVSPWVWWADATPAVSSKVVLNGTDINVTSKEPSVKYRGIFLNDEAPSLTTWSGSRYGGRNEKFYRQVYELILRLKGDYLWPAMWNNQFSKDGVENKLANAELADKYGIVMGTSHHEPCYRAGAEWGSEYGKYKGSIRDNSAQAWNKYNLPTESGYDEKINTAINKFWEDGIERNKAFENICTVGMRGENDSSLPAADQPEKYADLLNYIINTQKELLSNAGDSNPTQLVIYKEVENAWNMGRLYEQDCMKDTYAMFCDDNFAYLRTLPTEEQKENVGGLGMYYHFDYVGGPKSYTWIQTTQLSRIWDQMSVAYENDIDDVWIVNVGDLKPMEYDISYFIDLGYDFDKWGVDGNEKLAQYKANWIKQQLGMSGNGLNAEQLNEASKLIDDYLDLETSRKVEHVLYNTASNCSDMYSIENYSEAQDLLMKCDDMINRANALKDQVPAELQAAFYQLVYYPAVAVPNVLKIQIYAALNNKYAAMGLTVANTYKTLCEDAIALDQEIYDTYNNAMPNGPEDGKKWKGMQSADQRYHIGMTGWQTDSGKLPSLKTVSGSSSNGLDVLTEQITGAFTNECTSGETLLPSFTNINNEVYTIELVNKADASYDYTAVADADWIKLSKTSGTVGSLDTIQVSVDWSKVSADASGSITISDGANTVKVAVNAQVISLAGLDANTYVMANDYATIDVSRYTAISNGTGNTSKGTNVENKMYVVPDNGKYMSSVRTSSSITTYDDTAALSTAPYIEYKVYVPEGGDYKLECQFNPTSNVEYGNQKLRYAVSVDGAEANIVNSISSNYLAGSYSTTWAGDIENNGRKSVTSLSLSAGTHTIRYYQCDPNMALIRMTVYADSLAKVYNSPAESYYVGKIVDVNARLDAKNNMYQPVVK